MKKKYKLKKGDIVWVKIPMNAKIIGVDKEYGYTLKTKNRDVYCYFTDAEVIKIDKEK